MMEGRWNSATKDVLRHSDEEYLSSGVGPAMKGTVHRAEYS